MGWRAGASWQVVNRFCLDNALVHGSLPDHLAGRNVAQDESGGNIEAEEELLAAACDLLPVLASAAGPAAYAPVFEALHMAPLLGRLKPRQPEDLRAVALGAIAEVAEVLQVSDGQRCGPHFYE